MRIEYSDAVQKFLRKARKSDQIKILKKVEILIVNPFFGKKLIGEFEGKRSIKAWPFRIIYRIAKEEDILYIITIEHRQQAYQ